MGKVKCQICNKFFYLITFSHLKKHGLTVKEYREKFPNVELASEEIIQSNLTHKGMENPMKDPKIAKKARDTRYKNIDAIRKKLSKALKGNKNSLGVVRSKQIREILSEQKKGEKNPLYIDGRALFRRRKLRQMNFKPYCEICGKTEGRLEVHHLDGNHSNNSLNNLLMLCMVCHSRVHKERFNLNKIPEFDSQAVLVSSTPFPLETIWWATHAMKESVQDNLVYLGISKAELRAFFKKMAKESLATPLEFVQTVWLLRNCSRALQTQLIRTRHASFSIQSMRVVSKETFAEKGQFHIPPRVKKSQKDLRFYKDSMKMIQDRYCQMLKRGIEVEDARGILPLNIYSTITMAISMRSLMHLLSSRLCLKAQYEIRNLAELMKEEIAKKMDPVIAECVQPPCTLEGRCQMRMENLQQMKGIDEREPCPRFVELFGGKK